MKKWIAVLYNKFFLTGLFFLVWMLFFDQNDWQAQQERKKELKEVESHISYLENEIKRMEEDHQALISDPKRLEQYAREQFYMKRDNEDVYVLETARK
jgi:cell division protein DivIC